MARVLLNAAKMLEDLESQRSRYSIVNAERLPRVTIEGGVEAGDEIGKIETLRENCLNSIDIASLSTEYLERHPFGPTLSLR